MKTNESGVGGKKLRAGSKANTCTMFHIQMLWLPIISMWAICSILIPRTGTEIEFGGRVYMSEAPKQLISLCKGQKIFNTFSAVRNHCHYSTSGKLVWQQLNCHVSIRGGSKSGESFSASTHRLVLGYA